MSSTRIVCPLGQWTAVSTLGTPSGSLNLINGHVLLVEAAAEPPAYDSTVTPTADVLDNDNRKLYYTGVAALEQVWAWGIAASVVSDSPQGA